MFAPADPARAPGCQQLLQVGDAWSQTLETHSIAVVAADADIHFTFAPLPSKARAWHDVEEFFNLGAEQLRADAPPTFQARAVSIRPLRGGPQAAARLRAESASSELLTVYRLQIGSDQLQVSVAGKGLVQDDGTYHTANPLDAYNSTLVRMIEGTIYLALLGWATRAIFKKPLPTPPDE
jgi:hypothetical protein